MELIAIIKLVAPWVIGILGWVFKDRILHALNIKKIESEIDSSTSDVIEKNLKLYQSMIDDLDSRHNKRIDALELNVEGLRSDNDRLKAERDDKESEVTKLREEIHEIKSMLDKALKQLEYYKKNSDIELPHDLQ